MADARTGGLFRGSLLGVRRLAARLSAVALAPTR